MADSKLYLSDNIDILRDHDRLPNESVDLVYLDPPFNSKRDYNAFFKERDGARSPAMIKAFADTWLWDAASSSSFDEMIRNGPQRVAQAMRSFGRLMPRSDLLAYLSMMAPRLVEMHRVLKPTGSLYLHCDPTASHYLKTLLDSIFGPKRFLNEIVWKRSSAHSDTKQGMRRCGKVHDILLVYTKTKDYTWNPDYTDYTKEYLESEFKRFDKELGPYAESNPTAAKPGGDTSYLWRVKRRGEPGTKWEADLDDEYLSPKEGYEYKGVPPYQGRYWAYSLANMKQFAKDGFLHHRKTGVPRIRLYARKMPGIPLQDIWDDIPPELGKRSLGYPTQKPQDLLERIIKLSSNPGEVVLDPFCGCGTAVDAARALGRKWIGIDVTHLAISLIKYRLAKAHGIKPRVDYDLDGEPADLPSAIALAEEDRFKFQFWAVGKLIAQPLEKKRGKDQGIDGRSFFHDGGPIDESKEVIISVKSGKPKVSELRDLKGVVEQEGAEIGVFVTLHPPTSDMKKWASDAGYYTSPWAGGKKYARLQIITAQELIEGKMVDCPPWSENRSHKAAPKARGKARPDYSLLPFKEFADEPESRSTSPRSQIRLAEPRPQCP